MAKALIWALGALVTLSVAGCGRSGGECHPICTAGYQPAPGCNCVPILEAGVVAVDAAADAGP